MNAKSWLVPIGIALALGVTACGSSDDKSSTTSATSSKAATTTVDAPPTKPPSGIQVTEPLAKTPPAGKKVIFLQCALPACSRYVQGWKDAAAALGWKATIQVFKPDAPGAALQQAIT